MRFKAGATAADIRAAYAKEHAKGEARVRAILESECPKPKKAKRGPSEIDVARSARDAKAFEEACRARGTLGFRIDVRTPNPSNMSTGSSRLALSSLKKKQRGYASSIATYLFRASGESWLPCKVTLTRVAPSNGLDPHDGLPCSMKSLADGIADALGLTNDRDERVEWAYAQRRGVRGEHAVEIEVARVNQGGDE